MKTLPWLLSVTVHGLVLFIGGLSLQQAVVGMAPSRRSIDVNLVAAPSDSDPAAVPAPAAQPEEAVMPPVPIPPPPMPEMTPPVVRIDPLPAQETLPAIPRPAVVLPSALPVTESVKPSSSRAKSSREHQHSPVPNTGKDADTEQSVAGAIIEAQPDYLSNPPPIYPQDARDQNQEGLVTLDVIVGTDGYAETVKVSGSSGYFLLDDAARDAVQHYRFRPATLGSFKVRSHVKVPIRFRLDE